MHTASSISHRNSTHPPLPIRVTLSVIGFSAIVAQIVLMRELLIASYGNELSLGIMLALWLMGTAVGSHFLGRLFRQALPRRMLSVLLMAGAFALYLALFVVRAGRTYWSATPGEALGPVPIFLTAFATLAVFCPISGWLFTVGSRCYADAAQREVARSGSSMYLLEALGSALGGLLASVIFIRWFGSVQIVTIVAVANLLAAIWITAWARKTRRVLIALVLVAGVLLVLHSSRLELASLARSWPGFRVLATATSPYGSLAVIGTEGNRSMIQNGIVLFTSPDPMAAEEAVHFPLLEHPAPRSVLLIGGGLNGSAAEILKYPTVRRVDYVELDPAVLRLGRQYFAPSWASIASDSRLHLHEQDGRRFVRSAPEPYDVIIVNLPEPQTAQLNRFYTREWFGEVSSQLAPGGVFGFQMHASEEYLSPQLAEFLRCLNATLRAEFANVVTIPGETIHFLASRQSAMLTTDPQLLLHRLKQRDVQTTFIREYYLPFRMTPERVAGLQQQLQPTGQTRVNRDFAPIAYFFNIELWSTQFSARYRSVFAVISSISLPTLFLAILFMVVVMVALFRFPDPSSRTRFAAGFAAALMGLTLMAADILLLLGFQAVYGYVFDELAIIIASFMAGMAIGSWSAIRHLEQSPPGRELRGLLLTQLAAVTLLLLTTPLIASLGRLLGSGATAALVHVVFLGLAILFGITGGYQFPVALRVFSRGDEKPLSPGTLYGLDLLGASVGAMVISAWFLPLYGFSHTAELIALANLGPVLVLALSMRKSCTTS